MTTQPQPERPDLAADSAAVYRVGDRIKIDGYEYEVLAVDDSNPPHVSVSLRPTVWPFTDRP